MDLCTFYMYFFSKADYYSNPAEWSFNCLQEMNKISDEADKKNVAFDSRLLFVATVHAVYKLSLCCVFACSWYMISRCLSCAHCWE